MADDSHEPEDDIEPEGADDGSSAEAGGNGPGGSRSAFEGGVDTSQRRVERLTNYGIAAAAVALLAGVLVGLVSPTYLLFLVSLAGMYALLSLGLNVQWGYAGLINFSVAAFFGLGAYVPALLSASGSPLPWDVSPIAGLFVAVAATVVLALAIGIPTLSLREDYLAIASLGLAEVLRLVVRNQQSWTNGTNGIGGIPLFFEGVPVLGTFASDVGTVDLGIYTLGYQFWNGLLNFAIVAGFVVVSYVVLRRVHRSPWGRVLRTIRSDEDLAEALGKNTYAFRMQAFVLGSVVAMLAGVYYSYSNYFITPGIFDPIFTFYAWIAVILGGSGSNRGALFGGVVIVAIVEGSRGLGVGASWRLFAVGALIIAVMRFRPQGVLPPRKELIWPGAHRGGETDE
ncbi:branched-chain amino acid ABC transporter permease [Halobacterium rubrum]|uniref:branched-chain amino acid ABC transporter permease n=1 Tax=Halobacterium TaxID=2239 RepID=UPI001F1FD240|nr:MULTISPECIES: branched-chain amino acid ABC transporter permease [Halobacterium]MDH5020223.1 branched-chain amino acid ABC transporter permease [Halobacterium rubrum]